MFIIWGTKVRRSKLGRVAEFCPICRRITAHGLERANAVSHLYYIPLGPGEALQYSHRCESCRVWHPAQNGLYHAVSRDRSADVEALVAATNPTLPAAIAVRLHLERSIAAGGARTEIRREFLAEPFLYLSPTMEARKGGHIDFLSAILAIAFFCFLIAGFSGIAAERRKPTDVRFSYTMLGISGACLAAALYRGSTDPRRYARRHVLPPLAKALRPLNPDVQELRDELERLRMHGLRIGSAVRADELHARIARLSATGAV